MYLCLGTGHKLLTTCMYLCLGTGHKFPYITSKIHKSHHFNRYVAVQMAPIQLPVMETVAVWSAIPLPLQGPQLESLFVHLRLSFTSCPPCLTRLLLLMLLSVRHHVIVFLPNYIRLAAPTFSPPTASYIQSTYCPLRSVHLLPSAFSPPTAPYIQSTYCPLRSVHLLPSAFSPPTSPYIQSTYCPLRSIHLLPPTFSPPTAPYIQSTYCPLHSVHPLHPSFSPPPAPCIQSTSCSVHSIHLLPPTFSPTTAPCSQSNYRPCIQSTNSRFSNIQSTSWTTIQYCVRNTILFHFTNMPTLLIAD